jgi:hypothetical protein
MVVVKRKAVEGERVKEMVVEETDSVWRKL